MPVQVRARPGLRRVGNQAVLWASGRRRLPLPLHAHLMSRGSRPGRVRTRRQPRLRSRRPARAAPADRPSRRTAHASRFVQVARVFDARTFWVALHQTGQPRRGRGTVAGLPLLILRSAPRVCRRPGAGSPDCRRPQIVSFCVAGRRSGARFVVASPFLCSCCVCTIAGWAINVHAWCTLQRRHGRHPSRSPSRSRTSRFVPLLLFSLFRAPLSLISRRPPLSVPCSVVRRLLLVTFQCVQVVRCCARDDARVPSVRRRARRQSGRVPLACAQVVRVCRVRNA